MMKCQPVSFILPLLSACTGGLSGPGQGGVNINICNLADTDGGCTQSGTNSNVSQTAIDGDAVDDATREAADLARDILGIEGAENPPPGGGTPPPGPSGVIFEGAESDNGAKGLPVYTPADNVGEQLAASEKAALVQYAASWGFTFTNAAVGRRLPIHGVQILNENAETPRYFMRSTLTGAVRGYDNAVLHHQDFQDPAEADLAITQRVRAY